MTSLYLMCFIFFNACYMGRSLSIAAPDTAGCQVVVSAVRRKSFWYTDERRKIIQWYRPMDGPMKVPACSCDTEGGEVSSIKLQMASILVWNGVCSGCPGKEVPDLEYSFSSDEPMNGEEIKSFGPCQGITINRCSCPGAAITETKASEEGEEGEAGKEGEAGEAGKEGEAGEAGKEGEAGETGEAGEEGEAGEAAEPANSDETAAEEPE